MDVSGYTAESVAVFKAALYNANLVLADETLSEDDQAIVDETVKDLSDAIQNLSKKDDTSDADDNTSKPDSGKDDENYAESPATGDSSMTFIWVAIVVLVLAGLITAILVKQRRRM